MKILRYCVNLEVKRVLVHYTDNDGEKRVLSLDGDTFKESWTEKEIKALLENKLS